MSRRMRGSVALLVASVLAAACLPGIAMAGTALSGDREGSSIIEPSGTPVTDAQVPAIEVDESGAPASESTPTAPPESTPTPMPYRVEDDNPSVRFTGTWTYRNASTSGRSYRVSRTAGSAVAVALSGTAVGWVASVGPTRGKARVYLDGVGVATVDLYSPTDRARQLVWSVDGLAAGRHTIKVVVLGTKNVASSSTSVDVDAFDCDGWLSGLGKMPGTRVQNGDKRLYRKGGWGTVARAGASGRNVAWTGAKGAGYTVRFKGTAATWYGRKGPDLGKAEVWLDGKKVAVVDQYSTRTDEFRVVYAATGLRDRAHTLAIKALSTPVTSGGGTRTELDAFQVNGTVLTCPRPSPFKYPWKNYIVIDKSSYKLHLVKNGWLIKTYPIAHGKNNCTPERVWRIDAKYPHTGGVYGPRKMRMFKRVRTSRGYRYVHTAYAIHGTNQEWVIGTQASHGCIRMYNKDVKELYPLVPYGTMVVTRR